MKYAVCTAILALSALALSSGAAVHAPDIAGTGMQGITTHTTAPLPQHTPASRPALPLIAQSLPNCGNYDGQYCAVPGATLRCQWQVYEPGRCRCTSSNVWVCG